MTNARDQDRNPEQGLQIRYHLFGGRFAEVVLGKHAPCLSDHAHDFVDLRFGGLGEIPVVDHRGDRFENLEERRPVGWTICLPGVAQRPGDHVDG